MAELSGGRGQMKVRATYDAYVTGMLAVNYNPKYRNHHFWAPDVGRVMQAAGLKNSVRSTQDVKIDYYFDATVILRDVENRALRTMHHLDDVPGPVAADAAREMERELGASGA
jgi:hypothetical protein